MDTYLEQAQINYRRRALFIALIAMIVTYIMWNIPQLDILMYPLRLFVTYVHESGHALAALLTGGQIWEFVVAADGSGHVVSSGGSRWLIAPAGYLGAALFGSCLFFVVNRLPRFANGIAYTLGGAMIVFTLAFVLPNSVQPIALLIGIGFGLALIAVAAKLPLMLTLLVLNVLAIITALNAVFDVFILMRVIDAGSDANDAVNFARNVTPFVPPALIALTWAGIALLLFALAFYYGAWKPLHTEINDTYNAIVGR
jgi:Peptidase M50B-like